MPALHDFDIPTAQYLNTGLYISFTCVHDETIIEIIINDGSNNWYIVPGIVAPANVGDPATAGWKINRGFHTFVWDGYDPTSSPPGIVASGTTVTVHVNHATPHTGYTALTPYSVPSVVLT